MTDTKSAGETIGFGVRHQGRLWEVQLTPREPVDLTGSAGLPFDTLVDCDQCRKKPGVYTLSVGPLRRKEPSIVAPFPGNFCSRRCCRDFLYLCMEGIVEAYDEEMAREDTD